MVEIIRDNRYNQAKNLAAVSPEVNGMSIRFIFQQGGQFHHFLLGFL